MAKKTEKLTLFEDFSPEKYPLYDTYPVFNVDKTTSIPKQDSFELCVSDARCKQFQASYGIDFELLNKSEEGYCTIRVFNPVLAVPITFLDKYNPDQFEIVSLYPYAGGYVPLSLAETMLHREVDSANIPPGCLGSTIQGKRCTLG